MQFSERVGAVTSVIQYESITQRLKNRLWNVPYRLYWMNTATNQWVLPDNLVIRLWADFLGYPQDELLPYGEGAYKQVKLAALELDWARFYDLVEFIANQDVGSHSSQFIPACNKVLFEERAGYRFIDSKLVPITSEVELAAVQLVLASPSPFATVSDHIRTALSRLADRPEPDCRNSIKESVSAVEATCHILYGESATLGQTLKKLGIHPALEKGFDSIYGYTSDADGIRHAMIEESQVDIDDAKFFVVSCSAFIGYLISKRAQSRL
jgi:hypothetical protein